MVVVVHFNIVIHIIIVWGMPIIFLVVIVVIPRVRGCKAAVGRTDTVYLLDMLQLCAILISKGNLTLLPGEGCMSA